MSPSQYKKDDLNNNSTPATDLDILNDKNISEDTVFYELKDCITGKSLVNITIRDFVKLEPGIFLNDKLIEFYLKFLINCIIDES